MIEIWKDISGFECCYQISNLGRIKSCERLVKHSYGGLAFKKERIIKQVDNGNGYWYCSLWKGNKGDGFLVHRLLAIAFIDNPEKKDFINHKDGDKSNNSLENLEWCTRSENAVHAFALGLNKRRSYGECGTSKKVLNIKTGEVLSSIKELSDKSGVSYCSLRNQIAGRTPNKTQYIFL